MHNEWMDAVFFTVWCLFPGLPAVITLSASPSGLTFDGVPLAEGCARLEATGAAVVGLNCVRGPATMLPLIKGVRAACSVLTTMHVHSPSTTSSLIFPGTNCVFTSSIQNK
jgi:methionine synthase I (cobalamin-dependent)